MKTNCRFTLLMILLVFYLNSVSCLESVEGFVGGNIKLPCIYDESPAAEECNVFWIDQDDLVVLDIKTSLPDYTSQDEKYRGRVCSFPEEYGNRNFSIFMTNLQKNDTGIYDCYLATMLYRRIVDLTVSDPGGTTTVSPSGGAAGLKELPLVVLSALCLLLC
ncbi:V-set domain-containing T-cell activation inhibitor 1-like [Cololabis saira]|uniref:V-set domain-containing T-cell activation inhibitor 1-like n=1 Tax=Cololabis saira TaxID=129043 RepID=UPI002AD49EAC|nr:V-set domain-containing T-cell activation inhibitor 1-like [Cololabis saira]XP_061572234.1 V-set domain-containing T-cell activation inhibitor 1-like [Cololabis saira]